jgi:hypothetical protein
MQPPERKKKPAWTLFEEISSRMNPKQRKAE